MPLTVCYHFKQQISYICSGRTMNKNLCWKILDHPHCSWLAPVFQARMLKTIKTVKVNNHCSRQH